MRPFRPFHFSLLLGLCLTARPDAPSYAADPTIFNSLGPEFGPSKPSTPPPPPVASAVTFPVPAHAADTPAPRKHFAAGVNYSGTQFRWRFAAPWALEARWQHGKSDSDFGKVTANVYGMRGYRWFKPGRLFTFYTGPEMDYASAKTDGSSYTVSGVTAGAFAGLEMKIAKNLVLGMDMGPYVISLKEKQTSTSRTNLDFVMNTGVVWYLF
jgi:hypothetical protein